VSAERKAQRSPASSRRDSQVNLLLNGRVS
jgi:hypothetical protein